MPPSAALVSARTRIDTIFGQLQNDIVARRDAVRSARANATDTIAPIRSLTISAGALRAITNARVKAGQIT